MNEKLKQIIANSTFDVVPGFFVYAKTASVPTGEHFMVSRDTSEITVVTTVDKIDQLDLLERNKDDYSLIALNVSVPFYSIGFLAEIGRVIADRGINILIISTYSRDYILVKADMLESARRALLSLGLKTK